MCAWVHFGIQRQRISQDSRSWNVLPSGWTRFQIHLTGLDLKIVLTHTVNFNASEQYNVTEADQELNSHRSTVKGVLFAAGTSDRKGEDKHASPQVWTHWRSPCPIS